MQTFTQEEAERRAKQMGRGYVAKRIHGRWFVWCVAADHYVEFDR